MRHKKIYLKGLHCSSCETLLQDEFTKIPGIKSAKVSQKDNSAFLEYEGDFPMFNVSATAREFGYEVVDKVENTKISVSWFEWLFSILIVISVLFVFSTLKSAGLLDGLAIDSENITYSIAFLIGIAASLSTCLMVVGSVVIAFSQKYQSNDKGTFAKVFKPNLLFHAGRLLTFYLLGGLLGLAGGQLQISGNFVSAVTITVGLVMLWLGLSTLGLFPSITNLGLKMPKNFSRGSWERLKNSNHKYAPFILGGLSFFLPCGFTQSMQIFALGSGSFQKGSLTLFLFALGTTPVLFLLGSSVSWFKNKKSIILQRAIGFLIIIFAIYTVNSGLSVRPTSTPISKAPAKNSTENKTPSSKTENNNSEQVVTMSVTSQGFEPSRLTIKKGVPVKWIINGERVSGCTNEIVVPKLGISQKIKNGTNIVLFTPEESGKLAFSCWMGMVRGEFVVN